MRMNASIYWLASYPKSGNTWFRAFIQNLREDSNCPVDINELCTGSIASSRGWIDEVLGFDSAELDDNTIERLRPEVYRWSSRESDEFEYHKIHDAHIYTVDGDPLISYEGTRGVLYILRNPLDVAISLANHLSCSIDKAIEHMGNMEFSFSSGSKRLNTQVRQRLLTWSQHVLSWVDAEGLDLEIIRYEDMKLRPLEAFTRAARFLQLPSDKSKVSMAIQMCDIRELQQQEATTKFKERPPKAERFFRKGIVGDWQQSLSSQQVDKIIEDHYSVMQRFGYLDRQGRPVLFENQEAS